MSLPFSRRVDENRVAEILAMIGSQPNRRQQPVKGDLAGEFDFWFDGGACRTHTGSQHFFFADGTEAHLAMPAPRLNMNVLFTEGEIVDIVQRPRADEPGNGLSCFRLDRLEQREP